MAAGDAPIGERVGDRLRERDETLATAESCTGGLVASIVTDVAGASDYFDRGVITYGYDSKRTLLGVSRESLDAHGAVSASVSREMARRIRDLADTTWGLSVTGIAGPSGGTEEKPVGTVYLGVAYAGEWGSGATYAAVEHHVYDGGRSTVKERAARGALSLLLRHVGDGSDGA